jgi:hypothetical protein
MGTHKLLIEVTEKCNMTGTLDEGSAQTLKQSVHNTTLMTRCCMGAYLVLPDGVLPYSAYPFMLHEKFALLWNIHIVDHQISIQSICCTGVQEALSGSCGACSQLLTHQIVEGILQQIKTGLNASTSYTYQPIGGLIKIIQKKCAMLDGLCFKQLSTS